MLTDEQLEIVLNKEILEVSDLFLLHDHIDYISDLQDEYEENMPYDVALNLQADLYKIIDKLEKFREKYLKSFSGEI